MIIYDLACDQGHSFEGWFQSPANFEDQLARGLVSCPNCGSSSIRRIPSAIHLGKADKKESGVEPKASNPPAATPSSPTPPQEAAIAAVRELISMINEKCEDVGKNFAEEARKIHYAEVPERPIRGEVSKDEYEELHEEGIDVFIMPRIKNNNLM